MANFSLNTKAHGKLTFWCRDRGGHVRLEHSDLYGSLGRQICKGGGFLGQCEWADNAEALPVIARRWWVARRKRVKDGEMWDCL
jgi:hypothetical protein